MNPIYKLAYRQGKQLLLKPKKTQAMLTKAVKKMSTVNGSQSFVKPLKENLLLAFNMVRDFISGRYRKVNAKTIAKMLGGLIYFVFIIDLVPDFLGIVGFADDAAVLAWVTSSLTDDIQKYKDWKNNKNNKTLNN